VSRNAPTRPRALLDRPVSIDAVWGRSVDRLRDRLAGARSTGEMLQIMESESRSALLPALPPGLQLVVRAAERLQAS
jgi:hypothetical protein